MNLRREKCFEIQFCCDLITFEKQKQRGEERRNRKLTFLLFFKFRAKFKTEKNSAANFLNEKSFGGKKFPMLL